MCFQVYLGSTQACPEIPYTKLEDHIFVSKQPEDSWYLVNLSPERTHRYRVGVMSCGCGLPYDVPVGQQDEWIQSNHRQFVEYLQEYLQQVESVELFTSWSGDEARPVENRRWITVQDLLAHEFFFDVHQVTVVYRDQTTLQAARAGSVSVFPGE